MYLWRAYSQLKRALNGRKYLRPCFWVVRVLCRNKVDVLVYDSLKVGSATVRQRSLNE
jgi:hypothetical protein